MMEECGVSKESESNEYSKWVIRLELSKEKMMDRSITMEDVHFAVTNTLKTLLNAYLMI